MRDISNSFLTKMPIAHRGLHSETFPENSIGAFEAAIKNNFAIELDVHLTTDGELVVFHDDNLLRMCGAHTDFRDIDSAKLKNYKLLNTNYHIPTLKEVLHIVDGQVPLLIEIKYEMYARATKVGRIEKTLVECMEGYNGEWAVQSFNPISVGWFKKHAPKILRGQLGRKNILQDSQPSAYKNARKRWGLLKLWAIRTMPFNPFTKPDFVNYCARDLKCISRNKRPLITFTVKDEEDVRETKKYNGINYVFERCDIFDLIKRIC